jgi:hypothetical protein
MPDPSPDPIPAADYRGALDAHDDQTRQLYARRAEQRAALPEDADRAAFDAETNALAVKRQQERIELAKAWHKSKENPSDAPNPPAAP